MSVERFTVSGPGVDRETRGSSGAALSLAQNLADHAGEPLTLYVREAGTGRALYRVEHDADRRTLTYRGGDA